MSKEDNTIRKKQIPENRTFFPISVNDNNCNLRTRTRHDRFLKRRAEKETKTINEKHTRIFAPMMLTIHNHTVSLAATLFRLLPLLFLRCRHACVFWLLLLLFIRSVSLHVRCHSSRSLPLAPSKLERCAVHVSVRACACMRLSVCMSNILFLLICIDCFSHR